MASAGRTLEMVDSQDADEEIRKQDIALEMAKRLSELGYGISTTLGYRIREDIARYNIRSVFGSLAFGILRETEETKREQAKYHDSWILKRGRSRADFVGIIWLENGARGATFEHPVLEVFGQGNLEELENIANEVGKIMKVKVRVAFPFFYAHLGLSERLPEDE